jgi:hypothetical protein
MSGVDELFESLEAAQADKRLPPVEDWHPERQGGIDIRIAADGTWYHEGSPIRRQALIDLFATVLRRDPDGYCLVTPAERLVIEVEDAPFIAVAMETRGVGRETDLLFTTNVGDHVVADADHPLRVLRAAERRPGNAAPDEPRPYVRVRNGLDALINRSVYYRLVDQAAVEGGEVVAYSRGARFVLGHMFG